MWEYLCKYKPFFRVWNSWLQVAFKTISYGLPLKINLEWNLARPVHDLIHRWDQVFNFPVDPECSIFTLWTNVFQEKRNKLHRKTNCYQHNKMYYISKKGSKSRKGLDWVMSILKPYWGSQMPPPTEQMWLICLRRSTGKKKQILL